MDVTLKVIPNAKKIRFQEDRDPPRLYITAPAVDGKANKAVIRFLSGHFHVSAGRVEIIKGLKNRTKTIRIEGI